MAEQERMIRPRCSVTEKEEGSIVLKLEMPGVNRENLDIRVEAGKLSITGHRPSREDTGTFLVRERKRGSFQAVYTLDDTIDPNNIDAVLEAGFLTLTLQRKESEKPRKIPIRS